MMNIEEFMGVYSMSRNATYKAIKKGSLIVRKNGKRTYITTEAAEAWKDGLGNGNDQ